MEAALLRLESFGEDRNVGKNIKENRQPKVELTDALDVRQHHSI